MSTKIRLEVVTNKIKRLLNKSNGITETILKLLICHFDI